MILAKRPRSDAEEELEWMDPQFQPFSGSLVPQPLTTGFPRSESLSQIQRFPAVWVWVPGPRVAKWLKWTQDSIRDSPQKSEFGSRIGLQRPLLLSRENVFDVLGLETGEGVRKWIKRVERNEKKRTKKRSQQHPVFPGGHPSKY